MQGQDKHRDLRLQHSLADTVSYRIFVSVLIFWILAGIIIALPLLGAMQWRDKPLPYYLEFPPRLGGVEHAQFSGAVFSGLAALILATLLPFIGRAVKTARSGWERKEKGRTRAFPLWGYVGAIVGTGAWILAWTRFPWFSQCQPYTFPLLWISYIIVVNAVACKRTGSCLILGKPFYFLSLFPASAVFWWFFEFLNRFVLNWYYVQIDMFGPWQYVFYASACFSTVLPAVLSTADLLLSFSFIKGAYRSFLPVRPPYPRMIAVAVLALAAATLYALVLFPNALFPLLWVSPLLSLVSLQTLAGRDHVLSPVSKGDWTRPVSLVLSALVCGFFWEMWNYYSMTRWEYSVPYVHRYLIFEMPVLGYAGYLPFGLECGAVGNLLKDIGRPGSNGIRTDGEYA